MNRYLAIFIVSIVFAGMLYTGPVRAEDQPFQLALIHPVQIRSEEESISIFRFNLIYGKNLSIKGLDLGIANHLTGGESKGLQFGLIGLVGGDFIGWMDNAVNIVEGRFSGLQSGFYNGLGEGEAVQFGIVNSAKDMKGFQLGVVNVTESMYGLQIGVLNIIKSKERFSILPIVNWYF
jgi:hypothetical protein